MAGRIVLFGATGYTGDLVARALAARGAHPVLAARSAERLEPLAAELGGLEAQVADVSRPKTVQALVEPGDILISTVGPFTRWGDPAVEAAIAAGATYLDSTGEPAFIRRVFEHHGPAAERAGAALLTAFGFDWVPGNLAGALALREAGPEAVRVEIGYFPRGGGTSGGTQASGLQAAIEPSFAYRGGRLRSERTGAHVRTFELEPGKERRGVSVGGSEHFGLPAVHPTLRDVEVILGMAGSLTPAMPLITGAMSTALKLPPLRAGARAALGRFAKGSTGGPDEEAAGAQQRDGRRRGFRRPRLPADDRSPGRGQRLHLHRRDPRLGRGEGCCRRGRRRRRARAGRGVRPREAPGRGCGGRPPNWRALGPWAFPGRSGAGGCCWRSTSCSPSWSRGR